MRFIRGNRENHNKGENQNKEENQNQPPRKPLLTQKLPKKKFFRLIRIFQYFRYFRGNPDLSQTA